MNKMRFEVADMPAGKVNGYLPMSWLKDHNPDINWEKGSVKWRSEYCKAHCLRKERRLEFITEEELLAEDPDCNRYRLPIVGMDFFYVFVSGYEFRRLVCLVSLFYVLF